MLCDAGATQHHLPASAESGFFTSASAAAGHACGRSRSVLAALASPRCAGAVRKRSGYFLTSGCIVTLDQRSSNHSLSAVELRQRKLVHRARA